LAQPILVVSADLFLRSAVQFGRDGRDQVIDLSFPPGLDHWPHQAMSCVILDVAPADRQAAYEAVRAHHPGPLIMVLGQGEEEDDLPPDPARRMIRRPFEVSTLLRLLDELMPPAPAPDPIASTDEEPENAPEAEEEPATSHRASPAADHSARPASGRLGASAATLLAAVPPAEGDDGERFASFLRSRKIDGGVQQLPHRPATSAGVPLVDIAAAPSDQLPRHPGRASGDRPTTGLSGRSRQAAIAIALLLAAGLLSFGAWILVGLLGAARDSKAAAASTRARLEQAATAVADGDVAQARQAVEAARSELRRADAVAGRRPVRLAASLPILSQPVHDLRRLLSAAHDLTTAADQAVAIQDQLASDRVSLSRDHRFDLELLSQLIDRATGIEISLKRAEAELVRVRGGWLEPGVDRARASGLQQVQHLKARARQLSSALGILPRVLGANGPRTYLVVMTDLAELRPSGGAPTALTTARVDKGVIRLRKDPLGDISSLRDARLTWVALPDNPWRKGKMFRGFTRASSSPHFPTSGEELLRAYEAKTRVRADGVICVDPLGVRTLLRTVAIPPVPGYGRVAASNVAHLTMRDAYLRWPDRRIRQQYNQALFDILVEKFLDGKQLFLKARALAAEVPGRHIQAYSRDTEVQALLGATAIGGALSPAQYDYLAVYTLNNDASRTDSYQRRAIQQRVQLLGDGAALVTRTIRMANELPSSDRAPASRSGGSSAVSVPTVAVYVPAEASQVSVRLNGRAVKASRSREADRTLLRVGTPLGPGRRATVEVRYRISVAAERTSDGLRYELAADPQPMAQPSRLEVQVFPPAGMAIRPNGDWRMQGRDAVLSVPFSEDLVRYLELVRTG
jgi:hypothetical protein